LAVTEIRSVQIFSPFSWYLIIHARAYYPIDY
jgi:hypothetical protein